MKLFDRIARQIQLVLAAEALPPLRPPEAIWADIEEGASRTEPLTSKILRAIEQAQREARGE